MSVRLRRLGRIRIANRRYDPPPYHVIRRRWRPRMIDQGYNALWNGDSHIWRIISVPGPPGDDTNQQESDNFEGFKRLWDPNSTYWIHIAMLWKRKRPKVQITICMKERADWTTVYDYLQNKGVNTQSTYWRRIWGDPVQALHSMRFPKGSKFLKQWSRGKIDFGRPHAGY